jgi:hypothetical protein
MDSCGALGALIYFHYETGKDLKRVCLTAQDAMEIDTDVTPADEPTKSDKLAGGLHQWQESNRVGLQQECDGADD